MLKGKNLYLSYGLEKIYEDANFNIEDNDKVGFVGVNGAGKTTLFKILLNLEELDQGIIQCDKIHIGYLPQEIHLDIQDETVLEYLKHARPIEKLENELNEIYTLLTFQQDDLENYYRRIDEINDELDFYHQYDADKELKQLLTQMQVSDDLLNQKVQYLSGGQKSKIAFIHVLYSNPEILLLDEPTNHLDAATKEIVIQYLKNYKGLVISISHDKEFLDAFCNHILFLDKATHLFSYYNGNYSTFRKIYANEMILKERRINHQEREIERLKELIKRTEMASRTNHKIKRLGQVRQKALEHKLQELEVRPNQVKHVRMKLGNVEDCEEIPLTVSHLTFHYPSSNILFEDINFELARGERFLIVGENGIGKSTLLKLLVGKLENIEGTIEYSEHVSISYYAQEFETLEEDRTIIDNLDEYAPYEIKRKFLSNFLFHEDEIYKKVNVLSPGEKARVALCKLLMEKSNLVILDEPTNHFDPETQKIIGKNFRDYKGTLIIVSHNPSFVRQIGITKMLVLPLGEIQSYSPDLLQYYYYLNTDLF